MRSATIQQVLRLGIGLAALFGLLWGTAPAFSQAAVATLQVTHVDTSQFPNVTVQVWAEGSNQTPLPGLDASTLQVLEDNAPMSITSITPVDAGIQVVFVVDAGGGLGPSSDQSQGVSGTPASPANNDRLADFSELWTVVRQPMGLFLTGQGIGTMLDGVDSMAVVVQQPGEQPRLLQPLTSSRATARSVFEFSPSTSSQPTSLGGALSLAMDQLEKARVNPTTADKPQAIILFSSGNRDGLTSLVDRARKLQVPIFPVLMIRSINYFWDQGLTQLASSVQGGTLIRESDSSWAQNIQSILVALTARRKQYVITYRSKSPSSTVRIITFKSGGASSQANYTVVPVEPNVNIKQPTTGALFARVETSKNYTDTTSVKPTEQPIVAQISWPPGPQRKINRVEFFANAQSLGTLDPRTLADPNLITIEWNLTGYTEVVTKTVMLEADVTDELGLTFKSQPVAVQVIYQIYKPGPLGGGGVIIVNLICPWQSGPLSALCPVINYLPWISLATSLVAVGAVGYMVANRSKFAGVPVIGAAVNFTGDLVDRLTHRVGTSKPMAQLIPLEGIESNRKSFDIFSGETRLGRSPKYADLAFQMNVEDSPLSRLQCTIIEENGLFYLRDEGSANGTYLNGVRLPEGDPGRQQLSGGDEIELGIVERGGARFRFEVAKSDGDETIRPAGSGNGKSKEKEKVEDEDTSRFTRPSPRS